MCRQLPICGFCRLFLSTFFRIRCRVSQRAVCRGELVVSLSREFGVICGVLDCIYDVFVRPFSQGGFLLVYSSICVMSAYDYRMQVVKGAISGGRLAYIAFVYDFGYDAACRRYFVGVRSKYRVKDASLWYKGFGDSYLTSTLHYRRIYRVDNYSLGLFISGYVRVISRTSGLACVSSIYRLSSLKGYSCGEYFFVRGVFCFYGRFLGVGERFQRVSRVQSITILEFYRYYNAYGPSNVASRSLRSHGRVFLVDGSRYVTSRFFYKYTSVFYDASRSKYVIYRHRIVISYFQGAGRLLDLSYRGHVVERFLSHVRKVVSTGMSGHVSVRFVWSFGGFLVGYFVFIGLEGLMAAKAWRHE